MFFCTLLLVFSRGLVCNKKARKVCCPRSSDDYDDREDVIVPEIKESEMKVHKPFQGCGNPLGQNQYALSGSGRSSSAPWAVSIGYYEDGEYQHECTGSILTPSIIITAAHCVVDNDK